MTVNDIITRILEINGTRDDDEAAHSMEDALRTDVLKAIANGTAVDPIACAAKVLETERIDFHRWCA